MCRNLPADWPRFGAVEFDSLCMRYDPMLPMVLSGITFNIEPGSLVGVVGRTGSGKSSLFAALFRLVEPDSGAVIIDGVDISTLSLSELRPRLAIVPQEPVVFSGTVRDNIDMFGESTDEDIWSAIEAAELTDVVMALQKTGTSDHTDIDVGTLPAREIYDFVSAEGNLFETLSAQFSWQRVTLNRGLFPTAGSSTVFSLSTTVPGSDLNYYRASVRQRYYRPLSPNFVPQNHCVERLY